MNKILINKTTGQIIEILGVNRNTETVTYQIYDNGINLSLGKVSMIKSIVFNPTIVCSIPRTYTEFMEYIGVETVKAMHPTFEESEDLINWCRPIGSTDEPTTIRVLIPNDLMAKEIFTGSPLDQLVQAMSVYKEWCTRGELSLVQYLVELLPEHKYILDSYVSQGVIIDYKV